MVDHAAKMLAAAKRARKAFAAISRDLYPEFYPGRQPETYTVTTSAGLTRLLIYRPLGQESLVCPVFVNIHGGGFVQGRAEDDGVYCQRIADSVGCAVVSLDYQLSPEHKFPVALEECYDAVKWITEQAALLRIDAARLAVGGHSAGGNLTAAICLLARERGEFSVGYQVLDYPVLDMSRDPYSGDGRDTLLTAKAREFFTACYVREAADTRNPLVSPLFAANLAGLPPALVISAEYDPLREEEELYVRRLQEAGVTVSYRCFAGCMHAFTHFGPAAAAAEAWELIRLNLRQALFPVT